VRFEFVSGNVALDFIGTVAERTTTRVERLNSPVELAEWLVQAGLLTDAPDVTTTELARARRLRETLYSYVRDLTAGSEPSRVRRTALNRFAAATPPRPRLTPQLEIAVAGDVDAALAAIAAEGIALAAPETCQSIRWCAGAACTRVFIDRSRGPSRRWCGMSSCGNRAKAANYRTTHPRLRS
jgi:predicted RNA-binding Zn ribbon-like protein